MSTYPNLWARARAMRAKRLAASGVRPFVRLAEGVTIAVLLCAGLLMMPTGAQQPVRLYGTTAAGLPIAIPADASGNLNMKIAGGGGTFTSPILVADGTVGAPSYSFSNETGLGLFRSGGGNMTFAQGGNKLTTFTGSTLQVASGVTLSWSSTTSSDGAVDTSLGRNAAGKITLTGTTPMLQLGGTTSSFPALKQSTNTILFRLADDSGAANIFAGRFTGDYAESTLAVSGTAPSALSACGGAAGPSFAWTNGTAAFEIITGATAPVATCTWTMPAAADKWVCDATDITTQSTSVFYMKMTASSTNSVTVTNFNTAGAATAVVASDHLLVKCLGG